MVVHGVPRPEPDHMAFLLDQVKYTLQFPRPQPDHMAFLLDQVKYTLQYPHLEPTTPF